MTDYLIIAAITLAVSALTFFSGFGLGTLLLTAFSLFFPVEVAIAATAVVHLLNNVFKGILIGRQAHKPTLLRFAVPAAVMAVPGALLLNFFSRLPALYAYEWFGHTFQVSPVKLTVAVTILGFSLFELSPRLKDWTVSPRYVPLGGALSGFFGGLSGQQGALRTAFLIRLGLDATRSASWRNTTTRLSSASLGLCAISKAKPTRASYPNGDGDERRQLSLQTKSQKQESPIAQLSPHSSALVS